MTLRPADELRTIIKALEERCDAAGDGQPDRHEIKRMLELVDKLEKKR